MMQSFRLSLLLVAPILWTCDQSLGATIRVERDGTGDYTNLHDAAANAQPGDTILIGPGRYTETIPFSLPGFTADTHMGIDVDNLTIRGVDRDAVIIGPTELAFDSLSPKGILTQVTVTSIRVESLTFENLRDGIYVVGTSFITECNFMGCRTGTVSFGELMEVRECEFRVDRAGFTGAFLASSSGTTRIFDSVFVGANDGLGVGVNRADSCEITTCSFYGLAGGVQYDQSVGSVVRCVFRDNWWGLISVGGATVTLAESDLLRSSQAHLYVYDGASLSGSQNSLVESTVTAVRLSTQGTCSLTDSDIVPGSGLAVLTEGYFFDPITIDLTNNYWGTEDADEIRAMIHDGNDDPSIHAFVDFEPFQLQSVPTATSSFGDFKARYGPHEE